MRFSGKGVQRVDWIRKELKRLTQKINEYRTYAMADAVEAFEDIVALINATDGKGQSSNDVRSFFMIGMEVRLHLLRFCPVRWIHLDSHISPPHRALLHCRFALMR